MNAATKKSGITRKITIALVLVAGLLTLSLGAEPVICGKLTVVAAEVNPETEEAGETEEELLAEAWNPQDYDSDNLEEQMTVFEDLQIGSYVTLGYYEQDIYRDGLEPIEWQILDRKDGKALLISRYILDSYELDLTLDYESEFLKVRDWLNDYFYNTAFDKEKKYIVKTYQEYEFQHSDPMSRQFIDSVFLLSSTEVYTYFKAVDGNARKPKVAIGTAYAKDVKTWWTRDEKIRDELDFQGSSDYTVYKDKYGHILDMDNGIIYVNEGGIFKETPCGTHGIRPAIWVDMTVLKSELAVPEEHGFGEIDSVLRIVEGPEGNVTFGTYEQDGNTGNGQEPIEWLVLSREGNKILLLSKYILDRQYYYDTSNSDAPDDYIYWKDSTIRTWLNSDFYNTAFSDEEKEYISLSKNISSYDSEVIVEETEDNVFLLSSSEVEKYFNIGSGKSQDKLKCEATEYVIGQGGTKNRWMVRDPRSPYGYREAHAYNAYGEFESVPDNPANCGVRPAVWVNVTENISTPDVTDSELMNIEFGEGITEVKYAEFRGNLNLVSIKIPEGVTKICGYAFANCSNLTSIELPESLKEIDYNAFAGCSSLINIKIPKGVTNIGDRAFADCSSLTSIEFPEGVTEINRFMFENCSNLTYMKIPKSVTEIDDGAFYGCSSLTDMEILMYVKKMGDWVFENCSSLTRVKLSKSLDYIYPDIFKGCDNLKKVEIYLGTTVVGARIIGLTKSYGYNKYNMDEYVPYDCEVIWIYDS